MHRVFPVFAAPLRGSAPSRYAPHCRGQARFGAARERTHDGDLLIDRPTHRRVRATREKARRLGRRAVATSGAGPECEVWPRVFPIQTSTGFANSMLAFPCQNILSTPS